MSVIEEREVKVHKKGATITAAPPQIKQNQVNQ